MDEPINKLIKRNSSRKVDLDATSKRESSSYQAILNVKLMSLTNKRSSVAQQLPYRSTFDVSSLLKR